MKIYTIGFTKKTAEEFFELIGSAQIDRLIDVRLNNTSQLAAFAKRDDLAFFLDRLSGADYFHESLLAPTQEIKDAFKKRKGSWSEFEADFVNLLREREIETALDKDLFSGRTALLCSEATPEFCHRRLVAEYLLEKWGGGQTIHLE